LNMSKEKFKFASSYNSIKEYEHGKNEYGGWKACRKIMVSEKIKARAKGALAFRAWTYSLAHLKVKFWQKWWLLSVKRRMRSLEEKKHLKRGDQK
jgi:hypothetical protein